MKRRRWRGLGGNDEKRFRPPLVDIKVCTFPEGVRTCMDGEAFIDTGAPYTGVDAQILPPRMLEIEHEGAEYHGDAADGVFTVFKAEGEIEIPGCTPKPLRGVLRFHVEGLPVPDTLAVLGRGALQALGATVLQRHDGSVALKCHPKRRASAPSKHRKGDPCASKAACEDVTICPAGVRGPDDSQCKKIRAVYDTGASRSFISRDLAYRLGRTGQAAVRTWAATTAMETASAKVFARGCPPAALDSMIVANSERWPGVDLILGNDYMHTTGVALHLWSTPPSASCVRPRGPRRSPKVQPETTIEW